MGRLSAGAGATAARSSWYAGLYHQLWRFGLAHLSISLGGIRLHRKRTGADWAVCVTVFERDTFTPVGAAPGPSRNVHIADRGYGASCSPAQYPLF